MNESSKTQHQEKDRVRQRTDPRVLYDIDDRIEQNIRFYATQPNVAITLRIEELEREWDMERYLSTNAAALALTGATLGLFRSRRWLLLTSVVMGFLFQHSVSGWCPPLPLFRRLGVRTRSEIDREKFALKTLRGDFKDIPPITERVNLPGAVMQKVNA